MIEAECQTMAFPALAELKIKAKELIGELEHAIEAFRRVSMDELGTHASHRSALEPLEKVYNELCGLEILNHVGGPDYDRDIHWDGMQDDTEPLALYNARVSTALSAASLGGFGFGTAAGPNPSVRSRAAVRPKMIDLLRLNRHIKWHTPPQRTKATLALANAYVLAGMDKDPSQRGLKQAFEECRSLELFGVCAQAVLLYWDWPEDRDDDSRRPRHCVEIARRIQDRLQELENFHVDKHAKMHRAELQMRRCGIILASMALRRGSGGATEVEDYDWSDERQVRIHEEEHNRADMAEIARIQMLMR